MANHTLTIVQQILDSVDTLDEAKKLVAILSKMDANLLRSIYGIESLVVSAVPEASPVTIPGAANDPLRTIFTPVDIKKKRDKGKKEIVQLGRIVKSTPIKWMIDELCQLVLDINQGSHPYQLDTQYKRSKVAVYRAAIEMLAAFNGEQNGETRQKHHDAWTRLRGEGVDYMRDFRLRLEKDKS